MFKQAFVAAIVLGALSGASAQAQDAPAPAASAFPIHPGAMLKTADGRRVGTIESVANGKDGKPAFAQIIFNQHLIAVPAETITSVDKSHFTTSLSYKDVSKL